MRLNSLADRIAISQRLGAFAREKKKRIARKDAKPQSLRKSGKKQEISDLSQVGVDHNFFASWRLCAKKKESAAADASSTADLKTQSQSAAVESQTERTTISLRLCALAREKRKKTRNSAGQASAADPQCCWAGRLCENQNPHSSDSKTR